MFSIDFWNLSIKMTYLTIKNFAPVCCCLKMELTNNFKLVYQEIQNKCLENYTKNTHDVRQMLDTLTLDERLLMAYFFCKTPWNIGSLSVLSMLQESHILTATQFILNLPDTDEIHLILNDFLEANYELLINIFTCLLYNKSEAVKLNSLLDESLRRLFLDLLENPQLNNLNYLQHKFITADLRMMLMQKHIDILLGLQQSGTKEAFRYFSSWINTGVDDMKFNKDLHHKLFAHIPESTLSYLFKLSSAENFKGWKFYIILLQTILSQSGMELSSFIRKFLKQRLKQIANNPCKNSMLHFLLTARTSTAITMDVKRNLDAYADWYKQNICDMKFVLNIEEFQHVVETLQKCVNYEHEEDYLDVHVLCNIAPPIHCSKLVQNYKLHCRARLAQIKGKTEQQIAESENLNNSIVINDSD